MRAGEVHAAVNRGRRHLADAISGDSLSRTQARNAVDMIVRELSAALRGRRGVALRHFGSFRYRQSRRSSMYDPATGRLRRVEGGVLVRFLPSPRFVRVLRSRNRPSPASHS